MLVEAGFPEFHFRKTSHKADTLRGFSDYVHLTTMEWPPILKPKLSRGFPHVRLRIPSCELPKDYYICKYNIARSRNSRDSSRPIKESPLNGYYYEDLMVLTAREPEHQIQVLKQSKKFMIEVLVRDQVILKSETVVECFCERDFYAAQQIAGKLGISIPIVEKSVNYSYPTVETHIRGVTQEIERYFKNTTWKGCGLDFDKLEKDSL